jgi:hypothetical protein
MYVFMKKNFFTKCFLVSLMVAICPLANAEESLDDIFTDDMFTLFVHEDVNRAGEELCVVSYDADTKTITYDYPDEQTWWGYAGWDWRNTSEGVIDLSAYSAISISITADIAGSGELMVKYLDQDVRKYNFTQTATKLTVQLEPDNAANVEYVAIKSSMTGEIIIDKITASLVGQLDLDFTQYDSRWNKDIIYSEEYESIIFNTELTNGKWFPWGYGNTGADYSEYDYVIVEFEPCDFNVWLTVTYNPENVSPSNVKGETALPGADFIAIPLDPEYNIPGAIGWEAYPNALAIRDIVIRADGFTGEAYLIVKSAYLAQGECPLQPPAPPVLEPDLIVTNVAWEPASPQYGDKIRFKATIENIGTAATPANVKHGLTFEIYDEEIGTGRVVAWCDTFIGADKFLAPGESAVLIANGGPGSTADDPDAGTYLYYGTEQDPVFVRAHVNDTHEIVEDEANNFSDFVEIVAGNLDAIHSPAAVQGNVFAENGVLRITGYSSGASFIVYNPIGQIVARNTGNPVNLASGIYVVKVLENNRLYHHKVWVK